MKLYVCWGTFTTTPRPGGHPCGNAYRALTEAGYEPEVVKVKGLGVGPLKWTTDGRREVEQLTGKTTVPALVTDSGEVVGDSQDIVEWASAHPAKSVA